MRILLTELYMLIVGFVNDTLVYFLNYDTIHNVSRRFWKYFNWPQVFYTFMLQIGGQKILRAVTYLM
jgi:hypothetical protein